MKCTNDKICVGFEADSKVYCYGSTIGCLWYQNSCNTDQDCMAKYNTSSPKYTDGDVLSCKENPNSGWRTPNACPDIIISGNNKVKKIVIKDGSDYLQINEIKIFTTRELGNSDLTYSNVKGIWGGSAYPLTNLFDKNTYSMFHPEYAADTLTITLNTSDYIQYIEIYNRLDCCKDRIHNYNLYLYNDSDVQIGKTNLAKVNNAYVNFYRFTITYDIPPVSLDTGISWKWTWADSNNRWINLRNNNFIGQWRDLGIDDNTNMTISFSIIIYERFWNWRNIIHVSNDGNNCCSPGQRIPAIWIWPNDTRLHFRLSSQDNGNNGADTNTHIPLNTETYVSITISKSMINIYYNGVLDTTGFTWTHYIKAIPDAVVYITDPWHSYENFAIRNLKMTNGNIYEILNTSSSYDATQDAWIFPNSVGVWYSLVSGKYSTQWSTLGIKSISNMAITFTLNIGSIPMQEWRSILHISNSGSNWGEVGDRIPGIWLFPYENRLHICFSTSVCTNDNIQEYFNSNRLLPYGVDCNVTIITYNKSCYLYIDNVFDSQINYSGTIITPNNNATVYVCDPWHLGTPNVKIKDLKISNGNKILIPPDNVGNFVKKGCYADTSNRAIPNYRGNVTEFEQCANLASTNNDFVFGVQYGGQCWTGRNIPNSEKYGTLIENSCIMNGIDLGGEGAQFVYQGPDYTNANYILSTSELDCYRKRYPDLANLNDTQLQEQWKNQGANQNRDNQCPTIQQTSGLYDYKGAWADQDIKAIPTLRNSGISGTVDECKSIAEANQETVFGLQNYGQCYTGNNESDAYQYGPIYDRLKINSGGTALTNMVYVRKEAFPDPIPPAPILTSPNFSTTPIESFSNKENSDTSNTSKTMSISEKICGFILLLLFIIIILIIYKFNKK